MAINPCKECGAPVSDKAESCPMCGAKQPKKTSKITWFVVGLFVFIIFVGVIGNSNNDGATSSAAGTAQPAPGSSEKITEVPDENWIYHQNKDEMRGSTAYYAANTSTNTVTFDFPYDGGSKLILTLRKNKDGNDVILTITKGQILCDLRGCEAAFKFDNGSVQSITMSEPDNHSSDTLFVTYDKTEAQIIKQIKQSKKLVIEVPFYQEGRKQFTFDVSGLKWEH